MVGKRREKMMKMTEKSIENQKKKLLDYIPTKVQGKIKLLFDRCFTRTFHAF